MKTVLSYVGVAVLSAMTTFLILNYNKKTNFFYTLGVEDTHREAFENGLMIPELVNDEIVYRWVETHDLICPEHD